MKLDLLTDPDMYIAFENALRGGVCVASHRYVESNVPESVNYDQTKPIKHVRYDDANNLYGWAMIQKLPVSDFKWDEKVEKYTAESIMMIGDDDEYGCHLCVDIDYPHEIHDEHADYPLLPERRKVELEELSQYSKDMAPKTYSSCEKLVGTLYDKRSYWIHYRNLKFTLSKGLMLKKVHKVITYKQENWMASYIMKNTNMRKKAKNEFEKKLFKLMNNSVFGKTMENKRAQRDFHLIREGENRRWNRFISHPNYKGRTQNANIGGDLHVLERDKLSLKLDMPIYVGVSILDLSKLHMQKFWYNFVREKYPQAKLHYTDTDSLVYSIETNDDLTMKFKGVKGSMFDTSDLPEKHPAYCNDNKKVLGMFKPENEDKVIRSGTFLCPKSYTLEMHAGKAIKKCKGTKKNVVKKGTSTG